MMWITLAYALIPRGMQIHVVNRDGTWSDGPIVIVESAGHAPMQAQLGDDGAAPDMRAGDGVWTASVPDTPEGVFTLVLLAPSGRIALDAEVDTSRSEISLDVEFGKGALRRQSAASSPSPSGSPTPKGRAPPTTRTTDHGDSWAFWSALAFGVGLGLPFALFRHRRQPSLLRGRWPMRRSAVLPATERPVYTIGGDGVVDVLGDEAVRAASALGPKTILLVRDESALARRDERPALEAFVEDVDGRLEVWVITADDSEEMGHQTPLAPATSAGTGDGPG